VNVLARAEFVRSVPGDCDRFPKSIKAIKVVEAAELTRLRQAVAAPHRGVWMVITSTVLPSQEAD
jgi:hypothetical protein